MDKSTGEQRGIPAGSPAVQKLGLDWSPTGGLLALATAEENGRAAIWTIAADGGHPIQVLDEELLVVSPRFSPDGDALYYLCQREEDATAALWKVRIDPRSGRPAGKPTVVLSGLEMSLWLYSTFTISHDGHRRLRLHSASGNEDGHHQNKRSSISHRFHLMLRTIRQECPWNGPGAKGAKRIQSVVP